MTTNDELFTRAQAVIPGGVNSPVRAFGSVGGTPYFVARAEGPHVWDVEGRRYIDLVRRAGNHLVTLFQTFFLCTGYYSCIPALPSDIPNVSN